MRGPQAERQVHGQDEHDEQNYPELVGRDIEEGPTPHHLFELGDEYAVINSSREKEDSRPHPEEKLCEHEGREGGECEVNERLPPGTQFKW